MEAQIRLPISDAARVGLAEDIRQWGQYQQRIASDLNAEKAEDAERSLGYLTARSDAADAIANIADDCERLAHRIESTQPAYVYFSELKLLEDVLDNTYYDRPPASLTTVVDFIHDARVNFRENSERLGGLTTEFPSGVADAPGSIRQGVALSSGLARSTPGGQDAHLAASVEALSEHVAQFQAQLIAMIRQNNEHLSTQLREHQARLDGLRTDLARLNGQRSTVHVEERNSRHLRRPGRSTGLGL